jgi:hypothetical protein
MQDLIKSRDGVLRLNKPVSGEAYAEVVSALSSNITTKFRDAFESYNPNNGTWSEIKGTGDLVYVDGNAAAASYLVISKDPLSQGTETSIETNARFTLPVEVAVGVSMSQRTLGQEFSLEMVDTEDPLPDVGDIQILSISQATTTLTVDTILPHGLSVGKSIGIRGCSDVRANYPAVVVATVPSPTQFTVTAGPNGALPSVTIANPAGAKGFVFFRERLGRAQNGVSQIFENATVTNSSLYIRSESGDALPSGTIAASHSVTIGTTASVALVSAPYQYSFTPTNEFRFAVQADRTQWSDSAVDSLAQSTNRLLRTQVCPNPSVNYKFRIRAVNNKSLTVPVAQIVSAVKTGTTTATITTDLPHGLAANDAVTIYGIRDQTNFPNLTTTNSVASVIDSTTFTIVIGAAVTATSFGGYVAKINGTHLPSALGAVTMAAQSVALSTLSDGTRQLVVTGSAAWAGLSIGDLVNLVGVRDNTTGATLNVDGAWKVANTVTTTMTLVLPFPESLSLPVDFVSTNCGGGVIKRTDMRISYVRVFDYERDRVEVLPRPASDISGSIPVAIQGGTLPAVTTVTTVSTVTTAGTPTAPTAYFLNSAAGTNGALIAAGSIGVQAFFANNVGASDAFVKLYNKATAPTVGTDVPEMVIKVPAGGQVEVSPGFNGYRFGLGLGIAITGLSADTDTTAVAAGQVKVKLSRTV